MYAQWGMRAPGESFAKSKVKRFLWRTRYGKQAEQRQLIETMEKALPTVTKGKQHYIVTETMGAPEVFHMPGAVQRSPMGIGRYISDIETGLASGKRVTYGTEVGRVSLSDQGQRGIYENLLKFMEKGTEPIEPTLPKGYIPGGEYL